MSDRPDFIRRFYGADNRLGLHHIDGRPRLGALVDRFDDALTRPVVLPRMRAGSAAVEWYLLAGTDDDFRRATEEVRGAVGPTYGRWRTPLAFIDPEDPLDAEVVRVCGGRVLKFVTADDAEFAAVWPPLDRLLRLWAIRPERSFARRRPVGAVVRDIDMALAAGATDAVRHDLRELRTRGAVSVQNARFIEVRALAVEGRWGEMVGSPTFRDLCRVRRPWAVTDALAQAVHYAMFAAPSQALDVQTALDTYRRRRDDLDALLRVRGPLKSRAALLALAVRAAAEAAPPAGFDAIAADISDAQGRAWVDALAREAGPAAAKATARDAFEDGRFEEALERCREHADVEHVRVAVLAAFEIGGLDAAVTAMQLWSSVPEDVRDAAVSRRTVRDAHATVEALAGGNADYVTDWESWFQRVRSDPDWDAATAIARCGELEFAGESFDGPMAKALASAVDAVAESPARPVLLDALPSLLRWVAWTEAPASVTTPLHRAVLQTLALSDGWEAGTLEVAGDLIERLVEVGLGSAAYDELLDNVDLLWERMAARRHAAWFADVVEQLERHPGDRPRLASTLANGVSVLGDPSLIPATAMEALRTAAKALGVEQAVPDLVQQNDAPAVAPGSVSGLTVGVYSLTPSVLNRVVERIGSRYPGVQVITNSDQVATEALASMSRSVDIMVVAIGSAKHAATDAITAARPVERLTIRGAFKGSTRIVDAIVTAFDRMP